MATAQDLLRDQMRQAGLPELTDWAWNQWLNGSSIEQILYDAQSTPEFKARYPKFAEAQAADPSFTVGSWLSYEVHVREVAHAYGLPLTMFDSPDKIGRLIGGGVSPDEFTSRVQLSAADALQVDPEIRNQLVTRYGASQGDIAGFFFDPEEALPALQRKYAASVTGAAALRAGLGGVSTDVLEQASATGVSGAQAAEAFGHVGDLAQRLPGERDALGQDKAVLGAVGVQGAANELERRRRERAAQYRQGGSVAGSSSGLGGLGSASS